MQTPAQIAVRIADAVHDLPPKQARRLIAIAGPPASGKSTIAADLCRELTARGVQAGLVGMDGFHLDNPILVARALRDRKGAPETFDLAGFKALLHRLGDEGEVIAPTFDRTRDAAIASSTVVDADMRTVVVEGNYLLLDEPGWRELSDLWDFSVALQVDAAVTEARLVQRWHDHGYEPKAAQAWIQSNDMPNTRRVLDAPLPADLTIS